MSEIDLNNNLEKKLEIIDQLRTKHPTLGCEKGWSEYTGGMKDSGSWFIRKMLDADYNDLNDLLKKIIEEENRPPIKLSPEEQEKRDNAETMEINVDGKKFYCNSYDFEKMEEHFNAGEYRRFISKDTI